MEIPLQQCVNDLIIDNEKCVRHLDTKIFIALAHKNITNQELKQNKHLTQIIIMYNKTNS